ncbi:hypothetical protein RSSM_04848 [Rhodopirellula sallentina SM41]|uniref:Uncharacterized protein n=1 Tax=Rhodopirellula sallentina SM41 TaxID=1263870 RepID=M5TWY7_9BACT|nr:hypothetical protein RSSM_04848 [Rhodopirellula sallentina SM41]
MFLDAIAGRGPSALALLARMLGARVSWQQAASGELTRHVY